MSGTRTAEATKATLVALVVNGALSALKVLTASWSGSAALLADGIHSLSDVLTDLVVLVGVRIGGRSADESHPYGHGKAETLATALVGLALLVAGLHLATEAVATGLALIDGEGAPSPHPLALAIALAALVVKEGLFRYTRAVGRRIDSGALIANAWHQRSDALSSACVAVAIGGAAFGGGWWRLLDPIGAFAVAVLIVGVALPIMKRSVCELLESSADAETVMQVRMAIAEVPGALHPHDLRVRKIGRAVAVDAHVEVDRTLDVTTAHAIAANVRARIVAQLGGDTVATIHVDPQPTG